jgi:hypothetical protein
MKSEMSSSVTSLCAVSLFLIETDADNTGAEAVVPDCWTLCLCGGKVLGKK